MYYLFSCDYRSSMVLQFYVDINRSLLQRKCLYFSIAQGVLFTWIQWNPYCALPLFALSAILGTFYKDLARCPQEWFYIWADFILTQLNVFLKFTLHCPTCDTKNLSDFTFHNLLSDFLLMPRDSYKSWMSQKCGATGMAYLAMFHYICLN
jgi:hypothetical protein